MSLKVYMYNKLKISKKCHLVYILTFENSHIRIFSKTSGGDSIKLLIAKPIINNEYWVVTDGDKKVGNVVANGTGFEVKLNGVNSHYQNTLR